MTTDPKPIDISNMPELVRIADYEAFRSAAGGWKDVDTDRLLNDIYADRRRTNNSTSVKL